MLLNIVLNLTFDFFCLVSIHVFEYLGYSCFVTFLDPDKCIFCYKTCEYITYNVISSAVQIVAEVHTVLGVGQAVQRGPIATVAALGCHSNHRAQNIKLDL